MLIGRRPPITTRTNTLFPYTRRFRSNGERDAQVVFVRERIGDEPVEHGIVIEPPPVGRDRIERHRGAVRRNERAGRGGRRRRVRRLVIGAEGRGGQGGGRCGGREVGKDQPISPETPIQLGRRSWRERV